MNEHELKIHPKYFELVKEGIKQWELRYNDRNYCIGDILILNEYLNDYTGRKIEVLVVDVFINNHSIKALEDNWVILSTKVIEKNSRTVHPVAQNKSILELVYLGCDELDRGMYKDKEGNLYKNVTKNQFKYNDPDNIYNLNYRKEPNKKINKYVVVVEKFTAKAPSIFNESKY